MTGRAVGATLPSIVSRAGGARTSYFVGTGAPRLALRAHEHLLLDVCPPGLIDATGRGRGT
jgi:hypothetical protein